MKYFPFRTGRQQRTFIRSQYGDLPDYTDPSEAPSKPVSSSPSPSPSAASATSTPSPSVASTGSPPFDSPSNSDKIVQMVEALIASNGNTSDLPVEQSAGSPSPPSPSPSPPPTQAQQDQSQPSSSSANASNTANRKCGPGYFRDPMGRCRRIRKPHLPYVLYTSLSVSWTGDLKARAVVRR